MKFLVTEIVFDFEGSDPDYEYKQDLEYEQRISEKYSGEYVADNEDELVDIVSDAACFCVQSLNYVLLDWLTISTPTTTHNLMAITYPPIFKATFRIREAYGNTRAYPVNREAVLLCQLTGNKTLRGQEISTIRELGFECIDTEGDVINAIDLY